MELKEFIKTAITDISDAISELQEELGEETVVNPAMSAPVSLKTITVDGKNRPIERLSFDVAVVSSESSGIDGKAKAGISVFGAKIGAETSEKHEHVSRLSFSLPIVFPTTYIITPEEQYQKKRPLPPID